jgi:hypothetical protein
MTWCQNVMTEQMRQPSHARGSCDGSSGPQGQSGGSFLPTRSRPTTTTMTRPRINQGHVQSGTRGRRGRQQQRPSPWSHRHRRCCCCGDASTRHTGTTRRSFPDGILRQMAKSGDPPLLAASELLAFGSMWHLRYKAPGDDNRFNLSHGSRLMRLNVGNADSTVFPGDYFWVHFNPRRRVLFFLHEPPPPTHRFANHSYF